MKTAKYQLFYIIYNNNTIIHFIETRLQNRIGIIIKMQMAWFNRLASNLVILNQAHRGAFLIGQEKITIALN